MTDNQNAMVSYDGDWRQMPLTEALQLVAEGRAHEIDPSECTHYDDGMRSFCCHDEDEHDPDCDCRSCAPEPADDEERLIHDHSMDAGSDDGDRYSDEDQAFADGAPTAEEIASEEEDRT